MATSMFQILYALATMSGKLYSWPSYKTPFILVLIKVLQLSSECGRNTLKPMSNGCFSAYEFFLICPTVTLQKLAEHIQHVPYVLN
jgi:hypothetical protein